jgi:YfiH family protein
MTAPIIAATLADCPAIAHGFFTRQGGVSEGIYASLNCGLGSKDEASAVSENRSRVAAHLGVTADRLLSLYQIHSATPVVVDRPMRREDLPRADALVTRVPGIAIGAMAADCTPVLFADPEAKVVGAAHAGWRGALSGVLEATVAAMVEIGARRAAIRAAVGPTINQPAYEVGPEFEAEFVAADSAYGRFFSRTAAAARPRFDLPGFVTHRLERMGLAAIERQTRCTYENESQFFSYRRATHRKEPDYGRQISAIVVT